jgi:hypothetical protein
VSPLINNPDVRESLDPGLGAIEMAVVDRRAQCQHEQSNRNEGNETDEKKRDQQR